MKLKAVLVFSLCFFAYSIYAQEICEDFALSKIPSSYSTGSFQGNANFTWNYVNARGNQKTTASNNAAISLNKAANACVFSDSIQHGIRALSFEWQQALSTNCAANVFVNDSCVGTLVTNNQKDITNYFSLKNIDIPGDCVIKIVQQKSTSGQLTIDNICFEYAEKPIYPFELQTVEQTVGKIQLHYNYAVARAEIYTQPAEFLQSFIIDSSAISVNLDSTLCGEFSIHINKVSDTSAVSRFAVDTAWNILQFAPIAAHNVVFSEIMVAPSDEYALPNYEYVELYNRSNCIVQLSDLELIVGTNVHSLPEYLLQPQSYVYIISNKAASSISSTENVCFMQSFPALPNAGQTLALQTKSGLLITSLTYSDDWYASAFKKRGGWSIEKIDTDNLSELPTNWRASENFKGGTPGAKNSIAAQNLDTSEAHITSVFVLNDRTLLIASNKTFDCETFARHCSLSQNNSILSVENKDYKNTQFIARLANSLERETVHQLFINENARDCAGNRCAQTMIEFFFADSLLKRNSVIFTEILFHTSSGNEKFIELYNNSNSYFNCAEMYLTSIDTANNDLKTIYRMSETPLLLPPHSYAVVSPNIATVQNQSNCYANALFIQPANMPSLAQSKGTLLLANKWGQTIDSLCYSAKWHSPYLAEKENVSLERLDFEKPTHLAENWYSSALTKNFFHSAGCENSHTFSTVVQSGFSLEKPNVHPAEPFYEQAAINYSLPFHETHTLNVRVFSLSGTLVKHLVNNQIPASEGTILWDCSNDRNETVDAGIYIIAIELFRNGKKHSAEKLVCTVLR